MQEENIWEYNIKEKYVIFSNVKDFFDYCKSKNKPAEFFLFDSYDPQKNNPKTKFEEDAKSRNIKIIYNDEAHPILSSKKNFGYSFINPIFLKNIKRNLLIIQLNYLLNN